MTMAKHIAEDEAKPNERVSQEREARAPYNFVPLPDKVVPAEQQEPVDQRVYDKDRYTGTIHCTLTTETPLYVRCGYTPEDFAAFGEKPFHEQTDEEKLARARFFHHGNPDAPRIPGSSLRGMLRALVEIASYGKMDKVTDRQLFYRSVADQQYRDLFVEECGQVQRGNYPRARCFHAKVHAGFLRQRGGKYIIEECTFARIDRRPNNAQGIASIPMLPNEPLYIGRSPRSRPNWKYQNRRIYVTISQQEEDFFYKKQYRPNSNSLRHDDQYLRFRAVERASFNQADVPNGMPATLVITGDMQFKHLEFVFADNILHTYDVSVEQIQRFEDDDQITQWQEDAFPKDQPNSSSRRRKGLLRDGEPVFFITDQQARSKIVFFGRAQLFRLPYGFAPNNFTPTNVRFGESGTREEPKIDLAEAVFGFVPRDNMDKRKAVAGRVSVSDATLVEGQTDVLLAPLTPQILGSPKPTTFQHYLVQNRTDRASLKHYASTPGSETVIRGHKLYWHKGENPSINLPENQVATSESQKTRIQPVKPGTAFRFDVRFENLSEVELGALLWVLRLGAEPARRLKLGMGKPLGMGAIKIEHCITRSDRPNRYSALLNGETWQLGETAFAPSEADQAIEAFERYVLQTIGEQASLLAETLRMRCLLALLSWPGPAHQQTQYMQELTEFRERKVLPSPLQVVGEVGQQQTTAAIVNKPSTEPITDTTPLKPALAVGVSVSGSRNRWSSEDGMHGVRVKLSKTTLERYTLQKGVQEFNVIGILLMRQRDAKGQETGGFKGIVIDLVRQGPRLYVVLTLAPKQ